MNFISFLVMFSDGRTRKSISNISSALFQALCVLDWPKNSLSFPSLLEHEHESHEILHDSMNQCQLSSE